MSWFNCKVSFDKPMPIGNGVKIQKVSESYLVEADDFTEVEAIVAKELMNCGGYIVDHIRKVRLYDVFLERNADRFYNCKVAFITLDVKGVERRKREQFVVQADTFMEAAERITAESIRLSEDSEVVTVSEADYLEVLKGEI